MIAKHVRTAARIIDRTFLAPRRRRKLMAALGCDHMITKVDVARRQHKPSKATQKAISARLHEQMAREVGQ